MGNPPLANAQECVFRVWANLGMDCCQSERLVMTQVREASGGRVMQSRTVVISAMVPVRRRVERLGRGTRLFLKVEGDLGNDGRGGS